MKENGVKMKSGNMSNIFYKDGVVYRDLKPASKSIHKLLKYLETKDINFVPRFLGINEEKQEMLSYVPGDVIQNYPQEVEINKKIETVKLAAKMLKKLHEATKEYKYDKNDKWFLNYEGNLENDVICHNDFAPYNVTFNDNKPIGIIDFDTACPAPRIWDVAYAVYRFVPLTSNVYDKSKNEYRDYDKAKDAEERKILLGEFLEEYGMLNVVDVLENVILRLQDLVNLFDVECSKGNEAFIKMKKEGHQELYKREIEFIKKNMNDWL